MIYAVVLARAGKSRLAPVLDEPRRISFVIAMLHDVLATCATSRLLDGRLVVADPVIATQVRDLEAIADPGEMNAAAIAGIQAACARGATTAIILPADIPLLSSNDLRKLF